MFGFVQLVPQLIINYKLKSVAHMPMKAMMYKTCKFYILYDEVVAEQTSIYRGG